MISDKHKITDKYKITLKYDNQIYNNAEENYSYFLFLSIIIEIRGGRAIVNTCKCQYFTVNCWGGD